MNTHAFRSLVLLSLGLCACERTVETGGTASTGEGGGASSSGAITSSHASSSSAGTGGQDCVGSIDVVEDNGAPMHWAAVCFGSWGATYSQTAVGYEFSGGPAPGVQALVIQGCENSGDLVASPGVEFSANDASAPGTYTQGTTYYTDSMGMGWGSPGDGFKLVVTKLDPVGGTIDGTFEGFVSNGGNAAHSVTATFHVCRVPDELAP